MKEGFIFKQIKENVFQIVSNLTKVKAQCFDGFPTNFFMLFLGVSGEYNGRINEN
jgi:hypothetical protein